MADIDDRLLDAVYKDDKAAVIDLLEKGANPNRALGEAVERVDVDIVKVLLEHRADPDLVLDYAVRWNNLDMVQVSLDNGADPNKVNVVEVAALKGDIDLVRYLVDKGADINKGNVVEIAASEGHIDLVKYLLDKGADINKGNVVEAAAWTGHIDLVRYLLDKGADINKGDVLKAAVSFRVSSVDMIKFLIDNGADIKKSDALSMAVQFLQGDIVSLLLESGDDPKKLSEEERSLMAYVIAEHQENVRQRQQEYSKGISGTVENPCNITIAVVGHQGVGKSCLVKQLIRESIPEGGPGSTDTADFYVNHLTYNPKTGFRQTLDENGEVEAGHHRIKRIIGKFRKGAKRRGYDNVPDHKTTLTKETYTDDSTTSEIKEAGNKESTSDHTVVTPEVTQGKKELPKEQRQLIDKIMREIPENDDEEMNGFVTIFDFGGECVFYNTHHCFLSSNMVFVLVIDVSMCLDREKSRTGYEIAEYWLKNIGSYFIEDRTEDKRSPPIIVVGSHLDQVSSNKEKQRELFAEVLEKLQENQHVREIIENHVQEMFPIANLHDSTVNQDVYEELWQEVMRIAPLQSRWKKAIPSKWVALEYELIRLKNKGQIILKYDELLEVNNNLPVPLLEAEIVPFLKNLKYTGTFLCFNLHTKHPFIVIQPQWIIDSFKQVITDQKFKGNLSHKLLARWSQYAKSGVLPIDFAKLLWNEERFRWDFETLCIVMESLSLLAKPIHNDPNTKVDYFIVPCMLPTASPELILPILDNAATTATLCLKFNKPFIPSAIWDKLITSCIHRFEKINEPEYDALKFIHRGLVCLKVNAAWNMIIHCKDNAVKVMMFTLDSNRSTAGVGVSLCSILKNLLQRILEQNHQSHLDYQFYLHNDYRFTAKDKIVEVDELKTFGSLECFGINGRTLIKKEDIYVWFEDSTEKVDGNTALPAELSADLPDRKLTLKEIGRVSKYIGSAYQTFFVGLGCPSELLEQEMEEHKHLAFRSRITKILIQSSKRSVDLKFRTVAAEMLQNGMDPERLVETIDCNRNPAYKDERLPDGWLQETLSINDVPVIARYIGVKVYFNMFLELGFQPDDVDNFDDQYRNRPTHDKIKALLETFITETQPPPTRNTILLAMQEFDMGTESLITAFIAAKGTS